MAVSSLVATGSKKRKTRGVVADEAVCVVNGKRKVVGGDKNVRVIKGKSERRQCCEFRRICYLVVPISMK